MHEKHKSTGLNLLCKGNTRNVQFSQHCNMFQSVSPGLVETNLPPREYLETRASLQPEDIADGILYALGTPPHVQVGFCNNKKNAIYLCMNVKNMVGTRKMMFCCRLIINKFKNLGFKNYIKIKYKNVTNPKT